MAWGDQYKKSGGYAASKSSKKTSTGGSWPTRYSTPGVSMTQPSPTVDSGWIGGGDTYGSADPWAVAATQVEAANLSGASEQEVMDYIRSNYTPALARLMEIPDLRQVLIEAARKPEATEAWVFSQVERTSWWQERSESMRTFDALRLTDPQEYNAQVDRMMAEIMPEWEAYGVDGNLRATAEDALRLGWNADQIRLIMAEALQRESDSDGIDGRGAADADELMRIARQEYLTKIDRGTAERWAIRAIRQGTSIEGEWRAYLGSLASTRFGVDPTSGILPADVMAPVKAAIAEALEMDPDAIDLLDAKWSEVLQAEGSDGRLRPMTQYEAAKWARSRPEYRSTKGALDAAAGFGETLGRAFGKVA